MQGLNSNLTGLLSQAFGEHRYFDLAIDYQRSLLMQLVFFAFSIPPILYAEEIFLLFGINVEIAAIASIFVQKSAIQILFFGLFEVTRIFLVSQNIFRLQVHVKIFQIVLQIILCFVF